MVLSRSNPDHARSSLFADECWAATVTRTGSAFEWKGALAPGRIKKIPHHVGVRAVRDAVDYLFGSPEPSNRRSG